MADKSRKRAPRLGRGLSSLMSGAVQVHPPEEIGRQPVDEVEPSPSHAAAAEPSTADPAAEPATAERAGGLRYLPIDALSPNPHQPRQRIDQRTIEQLAASIKADGLMQPIVVRPAPGSRSNTPDADSGGRGFRGQIVAGERRWLAAKAAGLSTIPAMVRELDDRAAAEWALIENLQREDLNPMDRAEAFRRLCDQYAMSHDQVAQRVGLERSSVSNLLRLLDLSKSVQDLVRQELLSMGQARAIAALDNPQAQEALASRAVREGLSVREVEKLARQLAGGAAGRSPTAGGGGGSKSAYLQDLERQLAEQLGTKVQLTTGRKKGAGKLTISFYSLDQFDAILAKLGVKVE